MSEIVNSAVIKVGVDGSEAVVGLRQVDEAAAKTGRNLDNLGKGDSFGKVGSDAERAANRVTAAEARMIASIQRKTAAEQAAGKGAAEYYENYAKIRGIDTTGALAPYLTQLRNVEAAQRASTAALNSANPALAKVGVSAAQTAAALRGVPAQFTDIITSIQGGQAPLTVFLQQGGQLKDMFGGAGNAARALGGYVVGLINPLTLAAGAAAALAFAYNQGSKEADAYNRAIVMTGNAAGVTSGQLADMAANISAAAGTQGQAAAAVAAIADTGRVAARDIERFSKAAADAQRVLGTAVADTAKEFADLGKNPVAALEKLNERYRFLTPAIYEMVKALEDQGRMEEAATAAQNAYADAIERRTKGVKDNLGTLETAWKNVGNFASAAWDKMLDIGREDTLAEKLAAVQKQIAKAQKPFDPAFGGNAEAKAQLAANIALEASLKNQIKSEGEAAAAASERVKKQEAGIAWAKEQEKYQSKAVKMENEVTAARNKGLAAGASQKEIEDQIAKIREKYADKGIAATINKEASAYATLTSSIKERIAATAAEASGQGPLTESQKLRVALDEQLRSGKLKLSAAHKAEYIADIEALAVNESIISSRKLRIKLESEYEKVVKDRAAATARVISAAETEADKNEELARTYGMTKGAIEAVELARLEEQLAQRSSLGLTMDEIDTLEKLIDAKKRSAAALSSIDSQEATKKANKAMTDEWEKTVSKYEDVFRDGFADMLNKGKDGWKSFTTSLVTTFKTSVADQIYKMFAQPFVVKMVGSLLGVTGGSALAGAAQAASGASQAPSLISTAANAYSLVTGGMSLAGGLGTGFMGSISGGLMGAGAGAGFTSAAGLAIGEGIAGVVGPSVAASISTGMGAVAAAMPWLAAAAIGGVLLKKAFGRGPKETTGTTLNGMFGEQGFTGTTDEAWKKKGGWFRSDKTGVDKTAIDAETAKQFTSGYDALKAASADFANVLGLNADSIKNRSQSLSIALTKDEEANKKAIADFFTGVGNSIAKELLPTLGDFAKEGEGASATLQRLATNYATIDAALTSIGLTFGSVGADSLAARERLVDLSGGIQTLAQNAAGFAQNFLTEAERLAPVAAAVSKAMGDLGFSMVDTREEFKELVLGLDLTTEAGAKNYAELMKLQGAFAQVYPVIDMVAASIDSIKESAAGLLGGVDDSFGVLQRIASAEKDRATKAHEATMRRLQASIDLETQAVAKRRALSEAVNSTLSQRGTGIDRDGAQAQIQAAIAIAKASGVLPSADSLKEALSVLSRDSGDMFATLQDQQRAAAQTQNSLSELGKLSDAALSVEERTLAALEAQKDRAQASYDAQIAGIDAMVSKEQEQIDALKGLDTRGLTIEQAIEGVRLAILAAQGNAFSGSASSINDAYKSALGRAPDAAGMEFFQNQAASGTSVSAIIDAIKNSPEARAQGLYKSLLGRDGDAGGIAYWTKALSGGMSLEEAREIFMQSDEYKKRKGIPGFAGGGYHNGGIRAVGELGVEIEATGASRIHSTREIMAALRNPSDSNAVLAAAVDRLGAELVGLRAETRAVATHSEKTARLLNGVIRENAITTKAEEV